MTFPRKDRRGCDTKWEFENSKRMRAHKLIQRRNVLFLLIVALLLLGIHHYADFSDSPASSSVAAPSIVPSMVSRPVARSLGDEPRQADASRVPESAGRATSDVAVPTSRYAPAQIGLSTVEVVGLGQPYELVVRMDPLRSIGRLAFTVSVDPHMLRVRTMRGGDWSTADAPSSFITEDGPATSQTTVEIDLSKAMPANGDGSMAVVQFEALEPGTATMIISDLAISDSAGTPIPYAASSLTAQTEVLSGPI